MISIKDAMKQTNYNEDLKNEFENYLKEFVNKNSGKIFLFSRNKKSPKIFLLQTNLTSFFKGEKYDISVLCYFPINFPGSPPEIYLEKIGNVKVNPRCNFYISEENLKINFILFIEWKCNFYCLNRVLDEIKNQFSFAFPIFNLPNEKNDGIVEGDCILNGKNLVEVEIKNDFNNNNNNNFNDFNNNFNDFNNNNNNNINNTHGRFNSDFIGKYNNNNINNDGNGNKNEFNLFDNDDNEINNNVTTNDDFNNNNNINDFINNNNNNNKSISYNYRGVPMNNTNQESYYNNPNLTIDYFNKLNINEPNFNNNNNLNNNNLNNNNNNNNLNNNNNNNLNNNNNNNNNLNNNNNSNNNNNNKDSNNNLNKSINSTNNLNKSINSKSNNIVLLRKLSYKNSDNIKLKNIFEKFSKKFFPLFKYKEIEYKENFEILNNKFINSNYYYFKNLIKIIFMLFYKKTDYNYQIFNIKIEENQTNILKFSFISGNKNNIIKRP